MTATATMTPTTTDTRTTTTATTPGRCWECGGPCRNYAGSAHGWRCRTCLTRYIDASAATAAAIDAEQRAAALQQARTNGGKVVVGIPDLAAGRGIPTTTTTTSTRTHP